MGQDRHSSPSAHEVHSQLDSSTDLAENAADQTDAGEEQDMCSAGGDHNDSDQSDDSDKFHKKRSCKRHSSIAVQLVDTEYWDVDSILK